MSDVARPPAEALAFLADGGEMGALMRAHDWAPTPLGAPETWPQPLRTAVRLLLNTGHPMYVWWGPELLCFYNDAYRASIGPERHPGSLGRPGREVWDEIWPIIGPQVEQVMSGGGATWAENALVPITRHGRREDVWWTYSYGPLDDEAAPTGVGGVLVICAETTEQVLAEQRARTERERQAFLLRFSDALRTLADPVAIQGEAARLVREHLDGGWCYYVEWDGTGTVGSVLRDSTREGLPSMVGVHDVSDAPEFTGLLRSGQVLRVADFATYPRFNRRVVDRYTSIGIHSVLGPSLVKDGRLVATLSLADTVPRDWSDDEVALVEEVAERTWAAVERARAEAGLRDSEERLHGFAEASSDVLWIVDAETRRLEYLSPAYEQVWGETRDGLLADLGRWAETVYPEDLAQASGALDAALQGQRLAVEYRIRRPDGGTRYIHDTGFPILGPDGRVRRAGGVAQDLTERRRAELALEASERRLRVLMEGIPQLVWRSSDMGEWTWASPQWLAFTGQSQEQSQGRGWLDAIHPDDREATLRAWEAARSHGMLDVEYRVRRASDGAYLWHHTRSVPVRDEAGRLVEWLGTTTDVQALKELQARQEVMVAELQHRTRNLITVVRSIARQTLASTGAGTGASMGASTGSMGALDAFRGAFDSRLEALSRVQGLLSRAEQEPITLRALLTLELDALGATNGRAGRVRLDGPPVRLRPSIVQTLALALHELATNARKYGALSDGGGDLAVRWRLRNGGEERRLQIEWQENGLCGAEPAQPSSKPQGGYGRRLIERALPYALQAQTTYELEPTELRCTIDLPLDRPSTAGNI